MAALDPHKQRQAIPVLDSCEQSAACLNAAADAAAHTLAEVFEFLRVRGEHALIGALCNEFGVEAVSK